jgi:hypothetical protein
MALCRKNPWFPRFLRDPGSARLVDEPCIKEVLRAPAAAAAFERGWSRRQAVAVAVPDFAGSEVHGSKIIKPIIKPMIAIFRWNHHPLTSYLRVPFGSKTITTSVGNRLLHFWWQGVVAFSV